MAFVGVACQWLLWLYPQKIVSAGNGQFEFFGDFCEREMDIYIYIYMLCPITK
jgi:hypothetical protein